ncbi:MAG: hypothetical protein GKR89_14165 [Candidatus Latescibacteria bacterium]|nr:hypothetical protein [Candidatus Latescibacterota bacterium]
MGPYSMESPPVQCEFRYNFMPEFFDGEGLGNFGDSQSHHISGMPAE